MRIPLLPHETEDGYAWLYREMEKQDGRWPGFESFGLALYGREQEYVTSGECYLDNPHTRKPGKCPSNLSGGRLGTMHAVGATGIFQCGEVLWQLQVKYDQFHGTPDMWDRFGKKKPADCDSLQAKEDPYG